MGCSNFNGEGYRYVPFHGFLYSGGLLIDIGTLLPSAPYTVAQFANTCAYGINDSGQIVGYSYTELSGYPSLYGPHAFVYYINEGWMFDLLANPEHKFYAYDINNNGQIVGSSNLMGWAYRAFLLSQGVWTELGTLGGASSTARRINDSGLVVGYSNIVGQSDSIYHAFLYSSGLMTDLGTLGGTDSYAYDINTSGQIVGSSKIAGDTASRAFIYTPTTEGGVMTDLNTLIDPDSGWTLDTAVAINDNGHILGSGYLNGEYHMVLLR
ncbi:MAG: DUF3466 family protein [Nitrospirae bacterium]|nr:DUF3466 family protein [Nitrospirota bacterium]